MRAALSTQSPLFCAVEPAAPANGGRAAAPGLRAPTGDDLAKVGSRIDFIEQSRSQSSHALVPLDLIVAVTRVSNVASVVLRTAGTSSGG